MAEEIAALERTGTWDIVTPPSSVRPITCKWVYKVKTRSDGSLQRYKARLVARGFQQEHGRDYDETFAPLTPKLSLQLKLHAFLLWSSLGFLMPVGVLLIRVSSNVRSAKSVRVLFYSHVALQIAAVVLATAGAVLSVKNFENAFNNTHQRIGLALYGLIWLQPVIGFIRPDRGVKARSVWYLAHWLLGIVVCVVGVANVYIGLHTYRERTGRSVRLWTVLLTVEVSAVALAYLLQDRWNHVVRLRQEETAAVGDGRSETTTEEPAYPANDHKEVAVMP
ncbi:hypothetical protein QYE76_015465 [Lolium multiflorum]|uniref:Cytochrome b561 domain-containing protein n=1 Tax=Lolium multiflorum TaxID=4521 RepID=A0AAD8U6G9_LOLMU|nr:hypothetical protein QYE76_015465 [Lolium multiflorum]